MAEEESLTCVANSPNLILALLAVAWEVNWGRANCHLWEESHLVSVKVVVNAVKELKELADYVSTDIDEEGLRNVFVHYGLLEE